MKYPYINLLISSLLLFICIGTLQAAPHRKLIVYDTHGGANWQELYLMELIPNFQKRNGIKIIPTWISFAQLRKHIQAWAQGEPVDADILIVHPSNAAKLIQDAPIPLTTLTDFCQQIPNLAHVNPDFFDSIGGEVPSRGKAVPQWINAYGFLYNSAAIPVPPDSFHQMHDWALNGRFTDKNGGHLGFISPVGKSAGGRKFIWLFLHAYGCDFAFSDKSDPDNPANWVENSTWEAGWQALREMVDAGAFYLRSMPETGSQLLAQHLEETVWGSVYAMDYFLWAMEQGRVPDRSSTSSLAEGTVLASSYWIIPQEAPHKKSAFAYLNYMLSNEFQQIQFQRQWLYPSIVGTIHQALPKERYGTLTPTWEDIAPTGVILGPPDAVKYIQAVGMQKLGLEKLKKDSPL